MFMYALRKVTIVGAIALLGTSAARAETTVTKFKSNGNIASSNSNDGTYALDLSVSSNDTNSTDPVTNLFVNKQACDGNGCTGIFGFGTIPNNDFKASVNGAKVNTNLASNPGFQMFSYVQDFVNGTYTQTQITPTGTVMLDWKAIPRNWSKTTGTTTTVSGNFATHSSGTQTTTRANVTGTFQGSPVTGAVGNVGTTKQSNFTIVHE